MRSRWSLLAIVCVLASLLVPGIVSASTAAGAETRVGGIDLQEQALVGVEAALTLELRQGCGPAYDDLASDPPLAPKGGGRLGSSTTRAHVKEVAEEMKGRGWEITDGGGRFPEEYLPGPGGARAGSSFPDITATKNGRTLRVNTVDTLRDGVTPTAREARNAARIRQQTPGDHLLLIPKPKPEG
jgi:hypothetical protein